MLFVARLRCRASHCENRDCGLSRCLDPKGRVGDSALSMRSCAAQMKPGPPRTENVSKPIELLAACRHNLWPVPEVPLGSRQDRGSSSRRIALDPAGGRAGARGDELLFGGFPHRHDDNKGLRTERQIALFRQREAARREQAERREAEARVRHRNFDLVQRVVLLVMAIPIGAAVAIGALGNPELLKLALAGASAWSVIAAALYRLRPKLNESRE